MSSATCLAATPRRRRDRRLPDGGCPRYSGTYQGAPVEAAFTSDGRHAFVSNYRMYGPGFGRAGSDGCSPIGITYHAAAARVWASSYSGWITVYEDR